MDNMTRLAQLTQQVEDLEQASAGRDLSESLKRHIERKKEELEYLRKKIMNPPEGEGPA